MKLTDVFEQVIIFVISHGNMIRMKYNEDKQEWKQVKYETHGCI